MGHILFSCRNEYYCVCNICYTHAPRTGRQACHGPAPCHSACLLPHRLSAGQPADIQPVASTCRFALQNGTFRRPEQPVSRPGTGRLANRCHTPRPPAYAIPMRRFTPKNSSNAAKYAAASRLAALPMLTLQDCFLLSCRPFLRLLVVIPHMFHDILCRITPRSASRCAFSPPLPVRRGGRSSSRTCASWML